MSVVISILWFEVVIFSFFCIEESLLFLLISLTETLAVCDVVGYYIIQNLSIIPVMINIFSEKI